MSLLPVASPSDRDLARLMAEAPFVRDLAQRLARGDADDVVQQTWLAVLRRPLAAVVEPQRWLGRIVRRVVSNLRRGERRHDARRQRLAEPGGGADLVPSSAELLEREERRRLLVAAVDALPPALRSVTVLRWFEGLPPREIAQRLGLSATTVSTLLSRALTSLRARLDASHGDRRAWLLPLCSIGDGLVPPPVTVLRAASAPGALGAPEWGTGAFWMTMKAKVVAAAAALVLGLGAFAWWPPDDAPDLPSTIAHEAAASVAATAAVPAGGGDAHMALANDAATVAREAVALHANAALTVQVVFDGDGTPVVGAQVELRQRGVEWPRRQPQQRTDGQGRAVFDRLEPGRYTPTCTRGTGASARSVELRAGQHAEARIELPVGLAIRGRVVDVQARPVADAEIVVADWGAGGIERLGRSAADGSFAARGLPSDCHVGARKRGYVPSSMRTFTTQPGAEVECTIVLHGGGAVLSGTVFGPDGAPIAGAAVRAGPREQNHHTLPDGASAMGPQAEELRSDERGRFEFASMVTGPVPVAVRAPGMAPWSGSVQLTAGSTSELPVHLVVGAAVFGVVRDDGGAALAGAEVRIGGWDRYGGSSVETAADGAFRLEGLPLGEREAVVEGRGAGRVATTLALGAGEERRWDPVLSQGLVLRGCVRDADGKPVVSMMIEASLDPQRPGDRWYDNVSTADDGSFAIPNCPPERALRLQLSRGMFPELVRRGVVPGAEPLVIELPRRAPVHMSGSVRGPDGELLPNVRISPHLAGYGSSPVEAVDPQTGAFELGPYPPGHYTVMLTAPGLAMLELERVLAPGEHWDVGELRLVRGGAVLAQVLGDEPLGRRPIATVYGVDGRLVTAFDLTGGAGRSDPLPPGDYDVAVLGERAFALQSFTVVAGAESRIDVPLAVGERVDVALHMPADAATGEPVHCTVHCTGHDTRDRVAWRCTAWPREHEATVRMCLPRGSYRIAAVGADCRGEAELAVGGPTAAAVDLTTTGAARAPR